MLEFYLYKQRMAKKGYHIYKVDKTVIEYFKITTKGNRNLFSIDVIKKLNRNFNVGKFDSINTDYVTKIYGALSITLNKQTDTIIGISNGVYNRKMIDKDLKQKLTTLFEVGE